jgi:NADPH:quinone reductase-like Zn-dependent oxidoreductase
MDIIKQLGADRVVDYTKDDIHDIDESFDFIFDTVGKTSFGRCKHLLKKRGVYISSELGPYGQNLILSLLKRWSSQKVYFPIPYHHKHSIPFISEQLENDRFKPLIDRKYDFDDLSKAYTYVLSGKKLGNVVINYRNGR